jgi:holo-[acyl-carrier protein] synthase
MKVGIDLVEISKFRRVFQDRPALLASVFTEEELRYSRTKRPAHPHLAARFAAKEAVLKALGTGLRGALSWQAIEVGKELAGAPRLLLHGSAAAVAKSQGITAASLSLSHSINYAIAIVLFLCEDAPR